MFGKDDATITDQDVGNFVKELQEQTPSPLNEIIAEVSDDEGMAKGGNGITTGTQAKNSVYCMWNNRQKLNSKPRT